MPSQAHLFAGIPVTNLQDLQDFAHHFGLPVINSPSSDDWQDWLNQHQSKLRIENQPQEIQLIQDSEVDYQDLNHLYSSRNTRTQEIGGTHLTLGAELTSRYQPAILDAGWDRGGRPEPFRLDLERITKIRDEIKKQWPQAEILMMDFHH